MKNLKRSIFDIIQIGDKSNLISRLFDIVISVVIITNIFVLFLSTFAFFDPYEHMLRTIELFITAIFCVEYGLRIWTADYLYPEAGEVEARIKFLTSFYGVVDLLTILSAFSLSGFVVLRMLRVVRIFHLFRINAQYDSFHVIKDIIWEKRNQLLSSLFIICMLLMASSLCMYSAEHEAQPEVFRNAFSGLWWAVSTVLTVGYGDIYPITIIGQCMAIVIAILGVGVVAIPTGIISAGFVEQYQKAKSLSLYHNNSNLHFITLRITSTHQWKDQLIRDISVPEGLNITLIIRDQNAMVPKGNVKIQEEDCVILSAIAYVDNLNIQFTERPVPEGSDWDGKTVNELDISRLTTIVAVKRGERLIIPNGRTMLKAGDIVTLFSKKK